MNLVESGDELLSITWTEDNISSELFGIWMGEDGMVQFRAHGEDCTNTIALHKAIEAFTATYLKEKDCTA
jgi:SHS2 domain-containing protein